MNFSACPSSSFYCAKSQCAAPLRFIASKFSAMAEYRKA